MNTLFCFIMMIFLCLFIYFFYDYRYFYHYTFLLRNEPCSAGSLVARPINIRRALHDPLVLVGLFVDRPGEMQLCTRFLCVESPEDVGKLLLQFGSGHLNGRMPS